MSEIGAEHRSEFPFGEERALAVRGSYCLVFVESRRAGRHGRSLRLRILRCVRDDGGVGRGFGDLPGVFAAATRKIKRGSSAQEDQ